MNENLIAPQLNPGDAAKCPARQAEECGVYFGRFRPGYVMYIGPEPEKAWHFGKYPDSPSGRCGQLAKRFVAVDEKYEFPVFTGTHNFLQEELKQGGQNMHFTACDFAQMMLVNLALSASAISTLYGLPEYPREVAEDFVDSSSPSTDGDIHPSAAGSSAEGYFCDGSHSWERSVTCVTEGSHRRLEIEEETSARDKAPPKKTGSACRTRVCSKTKTARSIVQCCTLRRAMESWTPPPIKTCERQVTEICHSLRRIPETAR